MAIGKRVATARKVILESDPSILPGSDYAKYRDSLYDEKHLTLDPVNEATRFNINQLGDIQKDGVEALYTALGTPTRRAAKIAMRCSLIGISNFILTKVDGSVVTEHVPARQDGGVLGAVITEKWMEDLNIPGDYLSELYKEINAFSEVKLPLSMPSGAPAGEPSAEKTANT